MRSADLTPDGNVHTLIGEVLFDFGDKDGIGNAARLQHPLGIAWHDGKLYVADSYNHKVKVVDPKTKSSTSLLGTGKPGLKDGTTAQFSEPAGITFLDGKLYIADTNNNLIRVVDLATNTTSTLVVDGLSPPPASNSKSSATGSQVEELTLPNRMQVAVTPQTIKSGTGILIFDIALPKGYHLNKETSIQYKLEQKDGSAIKFNSANSGTIKPPKLPITVPIESTQGHSDIRIYATVYYCEEGPNAVCLVKTIDALAPVTVSASSETQDIIINAVLPKPSHK